MPSKPRRYMVHSLTQTQKDRMPEWRDRWIEWGLATGQTDRERVERGIRQSYAFAGLEPPQRIVWVKSPAILAAAAPTAALLLDLRRRGAIAPNAVDDAVRDAVGGAVRDSVRDAVDGAVDGAVRDAVDGAIDDAVRDAVDDAVRDSVRDAVDGAVDGAVRDAVGGAVGGDARLSTLHRAVLDVISAGWYRVLGGRWWAGGWWWGLAYVTFFRDVVNLELANNLWDRTAAYEDMMSAGWIWPHREFAMVCELPTYIRREEANGDRIRRLHCTDGPAIAWPDGTCIYFVRGVRVDDTEWIADRAKLTPQRITSEPNAEVRRVMIEMYGSMDRYMRDAGAREAHRDECGTLYRLEQSGDEAITIVRVTNSTPEPVGYMPGNGESGEWRGERWFKHYTLRVDPELRINGKPQELTGRNAVAWTFGIRGEEYAPLCET